MGMVFFRAMASGVHTQAFALYREARDLLLNYSPTRSLLDKVIDNQRVKWNKGFKFEMGRGEGPAWCDPYKRIITLNVTQIEAGMIDRSYLVALMIFECCNAMQFRDILRYHQEVKEAKISKNQFVEKLERLEYRSAKACSKFIQQAVADKILPFATKMKYVYPSFDLHYKYQQLSGHSHYIAKVYEELNARGVEESYKGTWNPPFAEKDKKRLLRFFSLKASAQGAYIQRDMDKQWYQNRLRQEIHQLIQADDEESLRIARVLKNFLTPDEMKVGIP